MPRQAKRPTAPEIRDRNTRDLLGRPGLAGIARIGGVSARGRGGGQSVLTNVVDDGPGSGAQGQLLVLSATGDSIASGGDYVTFDTEVYRHGFDAAIGADGQTITWPLAFAGGSIQIELAWDTYAGGGTVEIEVNGEVPAWGLVASGTSGSVGWKRRSVHCDAGDVVRIKVTQSSGSAQTLDALVEFVAPDPTDVGAGPIRETLWLDARIGSVTSASVLVAGAQYRCRVVGNVDGLDSAASVGAADAVLYPSTGQSASSDANFDADTKYALVTDTDADTVPRHSDWFRINAGSGAVHVEPHGGPYSTPAAGHAYDFVITGEGSPVTFSFADPIVGDNSGQFRIDIRQEIG